MKRPKRWVRAFAIMALMGPVLVVAARNLPAGYSSEVLKVRVEIDGVDYGAFDHVAGLNSFDLEGHPLEAESTYSRITLTRDFVTDPSLYLWAKNRMSRKFGPKDIQLVTEDEEGNIVETTTLKMCQPLSWTVEAANPSLGGFNETIDLAVQEISTL